MQKGALYMPWDRLQRGGDYFLAFSDLEADAGALSMFSFSTEPMAVLVKRILTRERKNVPDTPEDSIFRQIAKYIDRHYAEDVTIERLVKEFYISPYHLSHMFKQKTGYSVKQYLLRRRLGEAQIRLAMTQDSVQTIAEESGFEDASYFSRIFSKYIGLTPTEYRKYRTTT